MGLVKGVRKAQNSASLGDVVSRGFYMAEECRKW